MNVLSLFDGMSCGQIALRELGVKVDNYFASEIDKYAIAQTQHNFPNTVQLGSVTGVRAADLPPIDLLIGGSPCQGFSFAGKQLNFNDPRSILFFEYVRILREIQEYNPSVFFLLENVRMRQRCELVITEQLGLEPVVINSALVSAQNRVRLYWTNIRTKKEATLFGTKTYSDIPQPSDRGLIIKDILDATVGKRHFKSKAAPDMITTQTHPYAYCFAVRGRFNADTGRNEQRKEPRTDGKTNCLTSVEKDNLIVQCKSLRGQPRKVKQLNPSVESNGKQPYQQNRIYSVDGLSPSLCSAKAGNAPIISIPTEIERRLTVSECSRLQTIPEWYEWRCSETQAYKMLGNGWTVEVIKHIFNFLETSSIISRNNES